MSKIKDSFLAVNKNYFGSGLKSIDILIISHIEEFERNNCKCYLTNKQFAEMFGESESTIKRALDKLDKEKYIKRYTINNANGSKQSRQRTLSLGEKARVKMDFASNKQGSNVDEARVKSEVSKGHNDPIKDNLKDKLKDNLLEREISELPLEEKKELYRLYQLNDRVNYGYPQLRKLFNLKGTLNSDVFKQLKDDITREENKVRAEDTSWMDNVIAFDSHAADYQPKTKNDVSDRLAQLW